LAQLATTLALTLTLAGGVARMAGAQSHVGHHHEMSDAEMKQRLADWLATHPEKRGSEPVVGGGPTVTLVNFRFEADGNPLTQIDTVVVNVGETVFWHLAEGLLHTVTNGTGGSDPEAGTLFNAVLDANTTDFSFQFNTVGTFPYFCSPHEFFDMKGAVRVQSTTGVDPAPTLDAGIGFTARPAPNPTHGGVSFRFTLRAGGPTSVRVFDVRGRAIATIVDRDLEPGTYSGRWDGRSEGGPVGAGVYYVQLRAPGLKQSQRITLTR
jgi:plastocyanin